MRGRALLIVGLIALGALVALWAGGCGDDNSGSAQTVPTTPPLTVPGEKEPPKIEKNPSTSETTTGEQAPSGGTGGQSAPQQTQQQQDTQKNDTPPPKGSPAEKFEQFCTENPGAC
jgi:hypothetical protein